MDFQISTNEALVKKITKPKRNKNGSYDIASYYKYFDTCAAKGIPLYLIAKNINIPLHRAIFFNAIRRNIK